MERDIDLIREVSAIGSTVKHIHDEMRREFADQNEMLTRIEKQCNETNGRVTALETVNSERARKYAELATLPALRPEPKTHGDTPITFDTVDWLVKYGGWLVGGTLGALKLLGKI